MAPHLLLCHCSLWGSSPGCAGGSKAWLHVCVSSLPWQRRVDGKYSLFVCELPPQGPWGCEGRENPRSISKIMIGFMPLDQRHFCLFPCKISVTSDVGFVCGEARAQLSCSCLWSLLPPLFLCACCGRRCLLDVPVPTRVPAWHSFPARRGAGSRIAALGLHLPEVLVAEQGAGTLLSCQELCDN